MERRAFLAGAGVAGLAGVAGVAGLAVAPTLAHAASVVPAPTAGLTFSWRHSPFARGAYSALAPGVSPEVRRLLAEAVLGGRIVLAGEYASPTNPATTTGAYLSGVNAATRLLAEVEPASAIVVGAGMAGAAAARTLADAGVEVTVLEANDRVGGRIYSDDSWGVPVELGAGWIHGMRGNPITDLATAAGLGLHVTDYEDSVVRDTRTGARSEEGERAQTRMAAWVAQLEGAWPPRSMSTATWLSQHGWKADRFGAWAAEVEISQEYGLGPRELGVRALEEGAELRGDDALVSGGYVRIVDRLLAGIEVRLTTSVAEVTAAGGRAAVTLATGSGSALAVDAVVVAVPLEILKRGVVRLRPVTASVSKALAALRTGELQKVVLRYDEKWWDDVTAIGVVGGGVPGAPSGTDAALRWTEFYDITAVLGFPALAGFSGGRAATSLKQGDGRAIAEAVAALTAGYARRPA